MGSEANHDHGFVLLPGLVVGVKVVEVCAINSRTDCNWILESLEDCGLSLIAVLEVDSTIDGRQQALIAVREGSLSNLWSLSNCAML